MKKDNENQLKRVMLRQFLLDQLTALAISRFSWEGLPEEIDTRFLEYALLRYGSVAFCIDPDIGPVMLPFVFQQQFTIYGYPSGISVYSPYNAYHYTPDKFLILYDNMERSNTYEQLRMYARRVAEDMCVADINVDAQKTPVLIKGTDKQARTMRELYENYKGNAPVIYEDKSLADDSLHVFSTAAPWVAENVLLVASTIWNEALTYLGIPNTSYINGSRKVADEVIRSQGGTIASRFSPQGSRDEFCDKLARLFGIHAKAAFRADMDNLYMQEGNGDNPRVEDAKGAME